MTVGELRFVPVGGVGEFGANLALYEYGGKLLMMDCGAAFADETLPGVDLLVPDLGFLEEHAADLVGLVLTHAHEDHLGAVAHLWPRFLRCPVYATAFTAAMLRSKLEENGILDQTPLQTVAPGGTVAPAPFQVTWVPMAHSIPEAHSIAIRTPVGTVVHSGDWKLDEDPCIGPPTDEAALRALGSEGVLALMGDSTNATTEGQSGSEGALRDNLHHLISGCTGRVGVTQFASNAARIETVAHAAAAAGRQIVVVGRSLRRTIGAARSCGYLSGLPPLLDEDEGRHLPAGGVLYLLTGCQGEPRGAVSRVASGEHRSVRLNAGDTVIFSSKVIPGNERAVARVTGSFEGAGVRVIDGRDHFVHVSGHPAREELRRLIRWLRPQAVVPIHGELRHLRAHAALADSEGVPRTLVVENGAIVRLAPGRADVVGEVPAAKLAVSGAGLVPLDSPGLLERRRMMFNGSVAAFVVLRADGALAAAPRILLRGLDGDEDATTNAARAIGERIRDVLEVNRRDNVEVELAVRRVLRGALRQLTNQRPRIDVEILHLGIDEGFFPAGFSPSPEQQRLPFRGRR